jgi:pyochelin synthetase
LKALTLPELVAVLRAMGVALWLEDRWVRIRAPRGVLTADLRRVLARQRGELAELLAAEALAQAEALDPREG